jgi:hypothetical protein
MGRPPKPPTADALNPYEHSMIAAELAYKHVRRVRQTYQRPRWVYADLLTQCFDIAFDKLMMLCRRYDGRGTGSGYLHRFLPQHCWKLFDAATERAMDESGHLSYEEVFADLL